MLEAEAIQVEAHRDERQGHWQSLRASPEDGPGEAHALPRVVRWCRREDGAEDSDLLPKRHRQTLFFRPGGAPLRRPGQHIEPMELRDGSDSRSPRWRRGELRDLDPRATEEFARRIERGDHVPVSREQALRRKEGDDIRVAVTAMIADSHVRLGLQPTRLLQPPVKRSPWQRL